MDDEKEVESHEDLSTLITNLIGLYQPEEREKVFTIIKAVNSNDKNKLKARDLKKLFRNIAKDWKISRKKNNKDWTQPMSLTELMKLKCESSWIIKDLLPDRGIGILSGDPGNFKTWSTLHFAICIAQGKPVYNHFETTKANVLIIDEEDNIALLQQRLKTLSADYSSKISFMVMSGFKTDYPECMDKLFLYIKKHKIRMIIFDSLVRIHLGDENSSKDISKLFGELRRLTTRGVAILLNHHHRKKQKGSYDSQPMRGSTDILAALDSQLQIEHKDSQLIITQTKSRYGEELKPFLVNIKKGDDKLFFDYLGETSLPQNKSDEAKERILFILTESKDWMTRSDIDNRLTGEVGKNNIGMALAELISSKELSCKTSEKGKKKYKLTDLDDDVTNKESSFLDI